MERRLAAILAADVVGYSRLIRADEEGTVAALKALQTDLIDPTIAAHRGRVVKLMGDGMLVEFASVVDAVRAAIAIQESVAGRKVDQAEGARIEFRVGINLGDVVIDGDDIQGDGVNVAARLEALAEPGGVFVSAAVYDQVRDRVDYAFEDLGDKEVKNIDRPVRVWRWARDGEASPPTAAAAPAGETESPPDKPSIIVLPFNNMSQDPEQEYFSDGISEDIITDLSKASGLFVIARNSAFTYKGKAINVPDICRELGVRFALEGSVRKAGNRVRVTAQLIDGSSGGHLWAERYDRDLTDIFEVQDDVTRQIVTALKVTLNPEEKTRIGDSGTKNIDAHDLFWRGRGLLMSTQRDREMFEQAQVYLRRAIEIDPDYGAPYGGLGMAHILDYQNRWSDSPEESLEKAKRFTDEAIAKDGNDPYAHYAAAIAAMFRRDYTRWAEEAERALELDPNHAPALNARGIVHIYTGNPKEAIPYIERAMRLDPALHQQYMHFLGVAHFVAGEYETAVTMFRDRIAVNPKTDLSRAYLASALGHLGQMDEARRVWAELQDINPDYSHEEHISRLPFRDPADAAQMAEGLRKADLVE